MKKGTVSTIITMVLLVVVLVIILVSLIFGLIPTSFKEAIDSVKSIGETVDKVWGFITGREKETLLKQQEEEFMVTFDKFVTAYEKCLKSEKKDCICHPNIDKYKFRGVFNIKLEKFESSLYFEPMKKIEKNNFLITDAKTIEVGRQQPCVYIPVEDKLVYMDEMEIRSQNDNLHIKSVDSAPFDDFFVADQILYKDFYKNVCFVFYLQREKLASKTYC